MTAMGRVSVRPPAVAGRFYSASSRDLRTAVETYLEQARGQPGGGRVKALIAPHAGYVYSGPIAGSAFHTLAPQRGEIDRVVLLGPAHFVPVRGLALPVAEAFETPLGSIPVDRQACAELAELDQVVVSREAHEPEHSLEVELPFLQVALGAFSLVPLVVGSAAPAEIAEVLKVVEGGRETLLVISSDLSHYLGYAEAKRRDERTAAKILALDATLGPYDACGCGPINGLLTRFGETRCDPELLDLRSSGDTAGDRDRVVGYAAVAFRAPA